MKRLIILLLILTFVLTTIPIYAEPSRGGYENKEFEAMFQGKSPTGKTYNQYSSKDIKDSNDYYISITTNKDFVEGKPGSYKFTPMKEEFLPIAKFKVEIVRSGKVISLVTSQDDIVKHIGDYEIGDTVKITDLSEKGSKGEIYLPDLHIILQEPGLEYKTTPGSYKKLTPGGTTELTITKKGKYLLAMQTMLNEYAAKTKDHTVTYEIWSTNGAHHAWGEKIYGGIPWAGWSHFTGITFSVEDESVLQDYSTLIIRTGTENYPESKPKANMQNEAVVEYRVTNSDSNTGMAEIEFEIKNAKNITVEGLLEPEINGEKITGKLDMSELYAFGELQKYPDYIAYPEISLDRQRWQNKKDIKVREYTAGQKNYKDAKGNYGNMTQNEYDEDHIARAIKVKWTVKDVNRPVTMTSYMKPFRNEGNIENNKDIVIIQNDKYEFSCFNNYTITHNTIYKPGEPKNKCTFWMMQPIHADDELEDEFYVIIRVEQLQNGELPTVIRDIDDIKPFKLNKDNPIQAIDFIADTPRYIITIYRKGKELDEYKDNERFKNQYFMGYEKIYNGEKYYYYKFYHSYDHGFFYPTQLGLSYMREDKAREFIGRFGYTDFNKWNKAIR